MGKLFNLFADNPALKSNLIRKIADKDCQRKTMKLHEKRTPTATKKKAKDKRKVLDSKRWMRN